MGEPTRPDGIARLRMTLTKLTVERMRRPGRYGDGEGLWLQVASNSKSWLLRYQLRGRARYIAANSSTALIRSSTGGANVPSNNWPASHSAPQPRP